MAELSQAERTELETTMSAALGALGFTMGTEPESYPFRSGFERGWLAGRDYGREREEKLRLAEHQASVRHQEERIRREKVEGRERTLEGAPEKLRTLPCGAGSGERSMKATVECIASEALAPPGELEGQSAGDSQAEMMWQAERVDEVYGRRTQMEIYRLCAGVDETEGFATWSGPTFLDPSDEPLPCVPYRQFKEALDVLRTCCGGSQAADDFVFRMDVNHVRRVVQPDHGPGEPSDDTRTWNLFCPECEQTSVDMGDGSCETCGAQTISVMQAGESNG